MSLSTAKPLTAAVPALSIAPVTLAEGDGAATVDLTVTLERAHAEAIHVAYATLDGSAHAGTDYTAASGNLIFAAGELTKIIRISYVGNTVSEAAKTFTVALAGVSGEAPPRFILGKQSALVTLTDDDSPATLLVIGDSLLEGNGGSRDASFRLQLSRAPKPAETVSVHYATAAGTATSGLDFTPRSGTLVFTSVDATLTVPVVGDTNDERLETFFLTLDSPSGCTPVNTTATAQIIDEDMPANAYGNRRIVAYLDMTAGSVILPPPDRVTHLMAAFASVNNDGTISAGSARTQLRVWDTYAKVPFLYDVLGNRQWTCYDDPQSIFEKANYSTAEGYAGVFFWQLGGDSADRQLLVALSDSMATAPTGDSDGDGLPDVWELQYYANLTAVNGDSDSDGDGTSSYFEMMARTDPTDRLNVLRCGLHDPGTDHTVLGFDSKIGVKYRIERAFKLDDWQPLATVAGTGGHFHFHDETLPLNATKAFYRVIPLAGD